MIEWIYESIFGRVIDKLFDDYFEQIANRTKENYPTDPTIYHQWDSNDLKYVIEQTISSKDVILCGYVVIEGMLSDTYMCKKVISDYGFEKSLKLYCDSTNACITYQNFPTEDQIAKYILYKVYAPTLDELLDEFVEYVSKNDDYKDVIYELSHR